MKPTLHIHILVVALLIASLANFVLAEEKKSSKPKAWLGIATYQHKESQDRPPKVYIDLVWPASPAHEAGLQEGDRLISVAGIEVKSAVHIVRIIKKSEPGAKIELKWMRKGKLHKKTVSLAKYDKEKFEQIELTQQRDWGKKKAGKFIDPAELSEEDAVEIWYEVEDRIDVMLLRMGFSPEHCDQILDAIAVGKAELRKPIQKKVEE